MRYKLLGKSGLRVSELALGTMTFGEDWGWGASKEESRKIFEAFRQAGGNFIDTANKYTDGSSEKLVGEFIAEDRERFVVATKYSLSTKTGDPNAGGNHRKNMIQAVEASLKRLNTDYIDLYWLHAWDYTTPIEEVMRGLDDLVRAGKVLYIGASNMPAWIISQANTLAELRGWTPFVATQLLYNLLERTSERELLPMSRALDLGVAVWSPLGGGLLSGKYTNSAQAANSGEPSRNDNPQFSSQQLGVAQEVQRIAEELERTPAQVALNWVRQQQSQIIPIIGARKLNQFQDNLKCQEFELSSGQLARLDKVSKIELGFPHDFLDGEMNRDLAFGGMFAQIENHHRY